MLTQLAINNLAIVHSQTLELSPGLTVLTGETGAGKSLLLDGLGLILGERADSSLVTEGRSRAEVSASFDLTHLPEAQHWLQQLELEDPDHPSELHVRRTLTHDGRSKAYINGRPITLNDLKALAQQLVSLQGQHAQYAMLNPHEQLRILDQYAGLEGLKNETRRLWSDYQNLVKRRDQLANALDSADSGRELLRYQVSELQEAQLEANEVQALEEQLKHLSGAQEYKQSLDQAHHALTADQGGAVDAVQQALHRIGSIDLNTQDIENMLNEALINLNESAQQLSQQQDQIDDDPESLSRVESRLNTLHQLARKHRIEPEQLYQHSLDLERQLADLENQSNLLPELNAECDAQHALLQASADKLTMAREKAADLLSRLVSEQIKRLELSDATIAVEIKAKSLSAEGQDHVEFLFQANAGGSAKPLSKVASGGELSRVALAIQVCIAEKMQTPTLIFDEVDVGIGGRTAAIVGDMLKTLGAQTQVFVVTHQPQVAAAGTTHLHVSKGIQGTETTSRVSTLTASERVEEIARMLGGISITESTLASARELISG